MMTMDEWALNVRFLVARCKEQLRLGRALTSAELDALEIRFYGKVVGR